jgi:hypothetical protein
LEYVCCKLSENTTATTMIHGDSSNQIGSSRLLRVTKPFGRRPYFTVAWGNAPGPGGRRGRFWPKAIFTFTLAPQIRGEYGLRPKSFGLASRSWGVAPGYGEIWPSAKIVWIGLPVWGVAPGYGEIWPSAKIVWIGLPVWGVAPGYGEIWPSAKIVWIGLPVLGRCPRLR